MDQPSHVNSDAIENARMKQVDATLGLCEGSLSKSQQNITLVTETEYLARIKVWNHWQTVFKVAQSSSLKKVSTWGSEPP